MGLERFLSALWGLVSWEMSDLTLGHDNSGVWRNAF